MKKNVFLGVMKTIGNFAEVKRPEVALTVFIRFVLRRLQPRRPP